MSYFQTGINMKFTLFLIVTILFIQSCDMHDKRIKRKYIIENSTSREIKIDLYASNIFQKTTTKSGKGVIIEGSADDGGMNKRIDPFIAFDADSIVITFDNKKRQIYYYSVTEYKLKGLPDNKMRNVFNESAYTIESEDLYRYIFIEEDYENAEEI